MKLKCSYCLSAVVGLLLCVGQAEGGEIHDAIRRGDLKRVKEIVAADAGQLTVRDTDDSEWTPLHWAVFRGYKDIVEFLLQTWRVDVNARDKKGQTPLDWVATTEIRKLLLQHGAKTGKQLDKLAR